MDNNNNKLVVMHLIAAMNIAGAEKVILNLLSQKNTGPYDLRVTSFIRATDGSGTEFLEVAQSTGAVTDKILMYKRWDWGDVKALIHIIKKHDVKIIHSHGYKSDIIGAIASLKTGVPMIVTAHGFIGTDLKLAIYEKIGCLFLHFAKKVICVSKNVENTVRKAGLRSKKILLIPNAVDFDYFSVTAEIDLRSEWNVINGKLLIGCAGRLSAEKAQNNLIKAFALLPERLKDKSQLVLAGDGPKKDELLALVEKYQLEKKVIFTGFISDMRSFYKAIDIFCLPSLTEGLPLTILEAVASLKPIIASDVGSIGELIKDSYDGFLVPPGDIDELSKALERLLESDELRKAFALKLYDKLRKTYDIKGWADKIFNVYKEILDR